MPQARAHLKEDPLAEGAARGRQHARIQGPERIQHPGLRTSSGGGRRGRAVSGARAAGRSKHKTARRGAAHLLVICQVLNGQVVAHGVAGLRASTRRRREEGDSFREGFTARRACQLCRPTVPCAAAARSAARRRQSPTSPPRSPKRCQPTRAHPLHGVARALQVTHHLREEQLGGRGARRGGQQRLQGLLQQEG